MAEEKGVDITDNSPYSSSSNPYYRRRETPAVLASYPSLKRGKQEFKIRLLRYTKGEPVLDIREYVVSDAFTGFTRKGLTLSYDLLQILEEIITKAKVDMEQQP